MTGPTESSPLCGEGPTKLRRSESKGLLHTSEMLLTLLWLVWKAHRCKKKYLCDIDDWVIDDALVSICYFEQKFDTESSKMIITMNTPNYICLTVGSRAIKLSQANFLSHSHLWSKSRFYKRACTEKCEAEIRNKLVLGFMALRPGCLQKIKIFFVFINSFRVSMCGCCWTAL